jgi:hypothetical protein
MKARTYTLPLAAILVGSLMACGMGPTTDELDVALNEEYGALTDSDEEEDFGDADIANSADLNGDEDVSVDDGTAAADPSLEEAEADSAQRPHKLYLAVMWGHLRPDLTVDQATNWSGKISASNAALRVVRTIRFEGADRLLPRPNVRTVPFVSHTGPHADGLLLEVILHPLLVNEPGQPPVLALDTASFSDTLALVPGMALSRVVPVDASGNAVAYHIFRPNDGTCKNGILMGRYTKAHTTDDGRTVGFMKGKYLSFDGTVAGKIKGVWGERRNGNQVFFAKVIKRDGSFRGILAGRYGDGKLKGRYLARGRVVTGAVQGVYREAPEDIGGGFFMARWSNGCGELSTEGEVEQSDEDNTAVDAEVTDE